MIVIGDIMTKENIICKICGVKLTIGNCRETRKGNGHFRPKCKKCESEEKRVPEDERVRKKEFPQYDKQKRKTGESIFIERANPIGQAVQVNVKHPLRKYPILQDMRCKGVSLWCDILANKEEINKNLNEEAAKFGYILKFEKYLECGGIIRVNGHLERECCKCGLIVSNDQMPVTLGSYNLLGPKDMTKSRNEKNESTYTDRLFS